MRCPRLHKRQTLLFRLLQTKCVQSQISTYLIEKLAIFAIILARHVHALLPEQLQYLGRKPLACCLLLIGGRAGDELDPLVLMLWRDTGCRDNALVRVDPPQHGEAPMTWLLLNDGLDRKDLMVKDTGDGNETALAGFDAPVMIIMNAGTVHIGVSCAVVTLQPVVRILAYLAL